MDLVLGGVMKSWQLVIYCCCWMDSDLQWGFGVDVNVLMSSGKGEFSALVTKRDLGVAVEAFLADRWPDSTGQVTACSD